jgi:hypothetical protein
MQNLLQLKESFSEQGILISFNGAFTHSIIEEIGNAIRRYLEGENLGKGAITDVFAVYIEQTQNVRNYLALKGFADARLNSAIVVIGNVDGSYLVRSGNAIAAEDVAALTERLERVNSLDKEGLKRLYKEQLRAPRTDAASGAGLGLIDIARRASGKLAYAFEPLGTDLYFFSLTVSVAGA